MWVIATVLEANTTKTSHPPCLTHLLHSNSTLRNASKRHLDDERRWGT